MSFRRGQVEEPESKAFGKSKKKVWVPRPYQKEWLKLLEHTLPQEPTLQGPRHELYKTPISTYREKQEGHVSVGDGE